MERAAYEEPITLITLGPEGTCHERATKEYMAFQGVEDYEIELITDFFVGLEMVRETPGAFLVQCSAHPKVHEITETHWTEVFVVDTFIYPTKAPRRCSAGATWSSRARWGSSPPPRATSTSASGRR